MKSANDAPHVFCRNSVSWKEQSEQQSIAAMPVDKRNEYCESSSDDLSDDSCSYSVNEYQDDSDDYGCNFEDDGLLLHIQRICIGKAKKCQYNNDLVNKNAEELGAAEEREKRKAEKRKARKKRRKEKKKGEKDLNLGNKIENVPEKQDTSERKSTKSSITGSEGPSLSSTEDVEDEEEFLDVNSAFVSIAVSKKKKNGIVPTTTERSKSNVKKDQVSSNQVFAESERLAIIGYKMASKENYKEAVKYFSKAIRLVHDDHRFYSNRSFCHGQLGNYTKALRDADKAIALASDHPKGYYRRGEALKGLNQYREAEEAFTRVVSLDEDCEDAIQELAFVKLQQLLEMGFEERQASLALEQYHSVEAALNVLSQQETVNSDGDSVIFVSDVEDEESIASGSSAQQTQENGVQLNRLASKASKMDPSNPEGHLSLWVGNVSMEVTEKQLVDLFSKFGVVLSVRLLPQKYCAFINFRDKTSPGLAMKTLQNRNLGGERLLIRYPNKPVPEAYQQVIVKKTVKCPAGGSVTTKVTGPVNGDECHFWRTTGCAFGSINIRSKKLSRFDINCLKVNETKYYQVRTNLGHICCM